MIKSARPDLPMFALVDFDPDGVSIMRTYKYPSMRLSHEENAEIPQLRWLGIKSSDLVTTGQGPGRQTPVMAKHALLLISGQPGAHL